MSTRIEDDPLAATWKALSNPLRRSMLDALRERALNTGELAGRFPQVSRFAVMQHLKVLERGGLVMRRRKGRQCFHHLNPMPIQQIYHRWVRQFQEPWAEALVSMKAQLEDDAADEAG